mmetsp:Transcript_8763/g.19870  ORF Transcript_8763/g.19870 Transcript_8763/m.19870 type:complete len:200 (-) Transcript_8763:647-1246(-)
MAVAKSASAVQRNGKEPTQIISSEFFPAIQLPVSALTTTFAPEPLRSGRYSFLPTTRPRKWRLGRGGPGAAGPTRPPRARSGAASPSGCRTPPGLWPHKRGATRGRARAERRTAHSPPRPTPPARNQQAAPPAAPPLGSPQRSQRPRAAGRLALAQCRPPFGAAPALPCGGAGAPGGARGPSGGRGRGRSGPGRAGRAA